MCQCLPHPGCPSAGLGPSCACVCGVQWMQPPKATTKDVTPATLTVTRTGPQGRTPPSAPQEALTGKASLTPSQPSTRRPARQGQLLAAGKDGRITLRRSDTMEFAFNAKLPVGKRVKLELIGTMGKTELLIDGESAGEPENVRFPLRQDSRMSTFVLPLESLGSSFNGKVFSIEVK